MKLMKNYITFFDISVSKDASNFYQYWASGAREEMFYTSIYTLSRPKSGENRKKVGKVGPSQIYLQEIKVYLMKIKVTS